VQELRKQGVSLVEIRKIIDEEYAKLGTEPTPSPMPQ
jgi:hypothetical protein